MVDAPLPDPALVVLVGPSGAGKSTWAATRFRAQEIVASDDLRAVVGSGPSDLEASADAFVLLDQIVAARIGRGLTTVVDTLGMEPERRRRHLGLARARGLPAVAVVFETPVALVRHRNSRRDRPVPAAALAGQVRRHVDAVAQLRSEGWDQIRLVAPDSAAGPVPQVQSPPTSLSHDFGVILQVSRFPWGEEPLAWLTDIARATEEAGLQGIALMDHLIQIPQAGRAWEPLPELWVTLGVLAGLGTRLRLGPLVSPVTFRPAGITAKAAATLDAITGGGTFLGIGAGWWAREHAAYGLPFPSPRERLDGLESAIETIRALWAAGTKPYAGQRVFLPETTGYPRPAGAVPIVVGGTGARSLRVAARLGDGCNVPSDDATLARAIPLLRAECDAVGRPHEDVAVTVLDVPVVGRDRDDAWARVERLRGRTPAATYAARHHAGCVSQHRDRYARLSERGVSSVFLALPDLSGPEDVLALEPLASP
ncbi:LLM class flavin-dependent oxidoreductase [Terrabacter sp. BE26]|uniref:LLM class flavin-dependent oxidoreductase n=1 Tax=Terrabacter sp. BE26 TaxID=2898152 RepID=UPI0035BE7ADD